MADDVERMAERLESAQLKSYSKSGRGGKRGGGGGGGRGGRGGGRGGDDASMQLSKALSLLLRHQAASAGIKLDGEGYAPLDKVFQWPRIRSLKPTLQDVKRLVADSDKQRFALKRKTAGAAEEGEGEGEDEDDSGDCWLIRANQGHSIALASEGIHTAITLAAGNVPAVVVHGTYFAFWPAIVASGGLSKMGRTHVHFGTGLPEDGVTPGKKGGKQVHEAKDEVVAAGEEEVVVGDEEEEEEEGGEQKAKVVSGMRSDAEMVIYVDVAQSLKDDCCKWWMSANGVVLTEGNKDGVVPTKYFKEVRGRRQGVGLLWKDGEKVADLPEDIVAVVPRGKGRRGGGGGGGGRGRGGRGGRS